MKKFCIILLAIVLSLSMVAFVACDKPATVDELETLRIAVPDGAPALAVAKMIEDGCEVDGQEIDIDVVASSLIGSEVAGEKADIAIMPTNAAANIINQGGEYKIVGTNVFGLLYIIGEGSAETFSLNDLVGSVVACIGQSNTPQFVFESILNDAGLDIEYGTTAVEGKIVVNFVADGSGVLGALKTETANFGVIGEPAATVAGNLGFSNLFDLQQGYANVIGEETIGYPQASLVVKTSVLESRPEFVEKILTAFEENIEWLNNDENKANVGTILAGAGSAVTFPVTSIDRCNIRFVRAAEVKNDVQEFLSTLFNITLSDDAFYIPTK